MNGANDAAISAQTPITPRLRAAMPSLQPSDARVAQAVLDEPEQTIYRSVSEAAEAAGVSTATVVRCAQKLGFKGFGELKLALARELAVAGAKMEPTSGDGPLAILDQVISAGAESVRETTSLIDGDVFRRTVELLSSAEEVLFTGVGTSAPLAQEAGYRFRTIGLRTQAPADIHTQHVTARLLGAGDVCFAISHTGSTRETLGTLEAAAQAGATTVALTSFLHSPIGDLADLVLTAGTRELSFRFEGMASRLAHMAVLDALIVAVAAADTARSERALELYVEAVASHRL